MAIDNFSMFYPITIVDSPRRQVWAKGPAGAVDADGGILDWPSSKAHVTAWSEDIFKRSGGKSKGALRAMAGTAGPTAAGRVLDLQIQHGAEIAIGAEIVDDAEWRKVVAGVYTGIVIAGHQVNRWADPAHLGLARYTAAPTSITLVDAPGAGGNTFGLMKADGIFEKREFESTVKLREGWARAQAELPRLINYPVELHYVNDLGSHERPWASAPDLQRIAGRARWDGQRFIVEVVKAATSNRLTVGQVICHELAHILRGDVYTPGTRRPLSKWEEYDMERAANAVGAELAERWGF